MAKLAEAEQLVIRIRDKHRALGEEFARLWNGEDKPFALERTMKQYAATVKWYDDLAVKLAGAEKLAEAGKLLPKAGDIGLGTVEE